MLAPQPASELPQLLRRGNVLSASVEREHDKFDDLLVERFLTEE